jgi:hypothetical protein
VANPIEPSSPSTNLPVQPVEYEYVAIPQPPPAPTRSHVHFSAILLAIVATYLLLGLLVVFVPHRGLLLAAIVFTILWVASFVTSAILLRRYPIHSAGYRHFILSIGAFTYWNVFVIIVSLLTGWWSPHVPYYHFTLSVAIAALPLLLPAWFIARSPH